MKKSKSNHRPLHRQIINNGSKYKFDRVCLDAVFFIYWIAAPSAMARNDNVLMQPLFPIVVRLLSYRLSLQGRGTRQSSLVIASHVSGVAIHNTVFAAANKFIITGSPRSLHSLAMTGVGDIDVTSASRYGMTELFQRTGLVKFICAVCVCVFCICRRIHNARPRR